MAMPGDWRADSSGLDELISRLQATGCYSDISLVLPDQSAVPAHKLILSLASQYFEAQFHGPLASHNNETLEITGVDSTAFRRLLDFIYNPLESLKWKMLSSMEWWDLIHAAYKYIVSGLVEHCADQIESLIRRYMTRSARISERMLGDKELIDHVNKAYQFSNHNCDKIAKVGLKAIKDKLPYIITSEDFNFIQESVIMDLLEDNNLKVTEGQLFTGIVEWCRFNTHEGEDDINQEEKRAIEKFQDFVDKIDASNISMSEWYEVFQPLEKFIPDKQFVDWTVTIYKNRCEQATTRFVLNPYKVIQTELEHNDFLVPDPGDKSENDIFTTKEEFVDVHVEVRIYQKISQGIHVARGIFGILLETRHTPKEGADMSCITERVSVRMVAKREDGSVAQKIFKPIEDSTRDTPGQRPVSRRNFFCLSNNREERLLWNEMEVVVILDRRPECHIKAISGDNFVRTVCSGPARGYLDQAQPFRYNPKLSLNEGLIDMAKTLNMENFRVYAHGGSELRHWLYKFNKGFFTDLRSRRAVTNQYWTAETFEDYMRYKSTRFPIGLSNADCRRDAFETLIVTRREEARGRTQKWLFVARYNPFSQGISYVKKIVFEVVPRMETLGLNEQISLGTVEVTEQFIAGVLLGTGLEADTRTRIFIRRIFPIQDEKDESLETLFVSELIVGETLSHIDNKHALVIQEPEARASRGGEGVDYDRFILSKLREVVVKFEPKHGGGCVVELPLDPRISFGDVVRRLGASLGVQPHTIELFKCSSTKSMRNRSAEYPADEMEINLESLLDWCQDGPKTIFYRLQLDVSSSSEEEVQLQEAVLMDT